MRIKCQSGLIQSLTAFVGLALLICTSEFSEAQSVDLQSRPAKSKIQGELSTHLVQAEILDECAVTLTAQGYIPVGNAQQLNAIRQNLHANYVLTNDINLGNLPFTPLGPGIFDGVFDGCFKTISGLNIPGPNGINGLFSQASGTIRNLFIDNPSVRGNYAGALVGIDTGTITAIMVRGGNITSDYIAGGIAAQAQNATVSNCLTSATVSAKVTSGGVLGTASEGNLFSLANTGTVRGSGTVGGVVGALGGNVWLSWASSRGNIISTREGFSSPPPTLGPIGGLVGSARFGPTVAESFATGSIVATDQRTQSIGGLVGYGQYGWAIRDSFSNISIQASANPLVINPVGGLLGSASNAYTQYVIMNSYAAGPISSGGSNVGGIIGKIWDGNVIVGAFWDIDSTMVSSTAGGFGNPRSHVSMLNPDTYTAYGWNDVAVWLLNSGSYPSLRRVFAP